VIVAMNAPGPMITSTWDSGVSGLLVSWLPGVVNGDGIARALLNDTYEASGRLPVTFPKCSTEACSLQDERASVALGDEIDSKAYYHHNEKALIGYRWYQRQQREVSYPFGFGLFAYGKSAIEYSRARHRSDSEGGRVHCHLKNTGAFSGRDVPQLYLKLPSSVPGDANSKPDWVLKGFQKVAVPAAAGVDVEFQLTRRDLSYWDDAPGMSKWVCAAGEFIACIGANARDAVLEGQGSCVTFTSPCRVEAEVTGLAIKATMFDAPLPASEDQTAPSAAVWLCMVASVLLVGGLTLRRSSSRSGEAASQLSETARHFLGLEEQPLIRSDSCVE